MVLTNSFLVCTCHTQVEFSYPPLLQSTAAPKATVIDATDPSADTTAAATNSSDCPAGWKYLPTLALPDGSHNFSEDSVFFNLPSLEERNKTVFGVSCYRQIPVDVSADHMFDWASVVMYTFFDAHAAIENPHGRRHAQHRPKVRLHTGLHTGVRIH